MTEGPFHKTWKNILCGCNEEDIITEKRLESNRISDCVNIKENKCGEVELSRSGIRDEIDKLGEAQEEGCKHPYLVVRDKDFQYAKNLIEGTNIMLIPASKLDEFIANCEALTNEDRECDILGENIKESRVNLNMFPFNLNNHKRTPRFNDRPRSIKDNRVKTERLTSL